MALAHLLYFLLHYPVFHLGYALVSLHVGKAERLRAIMHARWADAAHCMLPIHRKSHLTAMHESTPSFLDCVWLVVTAT